jgi:hypothetical protein
MIPSSERGSANTCRSFGSPPPGTGCCNGTLVLGCVLGLAAHIGGFLIEMSSPAEPLAVVGDLLYALGWALWTGCVVGVFVQVIPDVKRRQIARAVEAYEASLRDDDGATRR